MDEYDEEPVKEKRSTLWLKITRFVVQLFFFILFGNLAWIGITFITEPISQGFPLPVMQSYATPGATVAGAYDLFMESLSVGIFPFLAFGIFLLFGIVMGRASCGWVCPFGFILDLCYYIPTKKRVPGYQFNQQLSKVKFAILFLTFFVAIVIGIVVLGGGTPLPIGPFVTNAYSPLDPATTLQAVIPHMIITPGAWPPIEAGFWAIFAPEYAWFWFRVILMLIFLILSVYIGRAWCRWFCPLGGALGLLTPYAIIGVQRNLSKCLGKKCRKCELACPMGVSLLREPWEKITDSNCIMCLKCHEVCEEGAITIKFFKFSRTN
ncbi:MAG: 4Fe-4S binding protein [Candidatus Helarchaeota archaeon]